MSKESSILLRIWTRPGLLGWTLLTLLASPVALARKVRRRRSPAEFDPKRWFVKRIGPKPRTDEGPRIAMVAASYGELLLARLVANELRKRCPNATIIYCVRDDITLEEVRKKQEDCEVAIWPFDFIYPVSKWLAIYQPDLLVFSERFRFTVFSRAAHACGAKVALINGRSKKRKSFLYSLGTPFYNWVFDAFDAMSFQNEAYREAAVPYAKRTKLVAAGDLKIDLQIKPLDEQRKKSLEGWLSHKGNLPMIAAGSTDYGPEDEFVLAAYRLVREQVNCRLLMAPRLLERKDEILETICEKDFTFSCRSSDAKDADIYVLDTLGELVHAYQYTASAYVGGALFGNGHNIVEPLVWGVPVAYGMNRGYFENMQILAEEAGLGTRVSTPEELAKFWLASLQNPEPKADIADRAAKMLEPHRGALDRTVSTLVGLLEC